MKHVNYIILAAGITMGLAACEKRDYPNGLPEYDHHYYAAYLPNNNSKVSVQRNQASLVKFAVQFYSAYEREYNAVAHYGLVTEGIAAPAVLGVDFDIVDKNGNTIAPVNGKYSFTFAQAKRATDTIYVKLLNNAAPGTRTVEVQIQENKTDQYYVDIFSTAFRRPLEIK